MKIKYNGPTDIQQEVLWKDTVDRHENYEMRFAADRQGNLWVSSFKQLSKIDLRGNSQTTFSLSNSLSIERRLTGIFTANDGKIFLTGTNGFSWFYPDEIEKDTTPVKVVLTELEIFNKPILVEGHDSTNSNDFFIPRQIDKLDELTLHYNQNFFSIRFAAVTPTQRDKIQYAYKLEGFDRDWVYVGNRRFASYTNLDPGTYKFIVKATNADGYWTTDPKSISLVILPPFWRTTWFIILTISLAAAVIYSIHRYRVAQTLKVERLRNKIASDLHDEVGSSLTRISIYSELLQNGIEVEERKSYLSGIGALSREVVSTMSDIVWSIDNRNDSFGSLIIRMRDFATELLQAKNIELDFKVSGVVGRKILDPALKQNIYLIFKESIHNVVKHSNARKVSIEVSNDGTDFKMIVKDDGRGFHDDNASSGNGMRNMKRRADAINAKFEIVNQSGTTISLKREHL
jgi:signal transduction histidine kinase